jgi:hypothetical protein
MNKLIKKMLLRLLAFSIFIDHILAVLLKVSRLYFEHFDFGILLEIVVARNC